MQSMTKIFPTPFLPPFRVCPHQKVNKDSFITSGVIPNTDKQTDRQADKYMQNITCLVKVIIIMSFD